jgi:hypothetical protein
MSGILCVLPEKLNATPGIDYRDDISVGFVEIIVQQLAVICKYKIQKNIDEPPAHMARIHGT